MQAYWLVVRVLLTPPAEAEASQKWKIIYLQVLSVIMNKRAFSAAGNKTESAECVALCRREEKKGVIL